MDVTSRKPVVAIVDDDPRMLESLVDLFESGGYAVRGYASSASLLEVGLAGVDVLVTDIAMTGTDGFALRQRVRQAHPELPVFLITGRNDLADDDRIRDSDGFFRKPFDATALLEAIAKALGKGNTGG
jgi:FixJ family two-component response regulator